MAHRNTREIAFGAAAGAYTTLARPAQAFGFELGFGCGAGFGIGLGFG